MPQDRNYLVDPGEPMAGLRKLETPRDERFEGVPTHQPADVAANPLLKTLDVPVDADIDTPRLPSAHDRNR